MEMVGTKVVRFCQVVVCTTRGFGIRGDMRHIVVHVIEHHHVWMEYEHTRTNQNDRAEI